MSASLLHPRGCMKVHCLTKSPKKACVIERELLPWEAGIVKNGRCNIPFEDLFANSCLKVENLGQNETNHRNAWKKDCEFFSTTVRFLTDCFRATLAQGYFIFPINLFQKKAQKSYLYMACWEPNKLNFSVVTEDDQSRNVEYKQCPKCLSRIHLV